ncbi:hypothetical protein GLYMA_02G139366v4 [Glycine max]|nr:hypothetical protein GLYMA_02G139366v4 [Glycine max]KAH1060254.1 hypothetical protein GYH30_003963 [Glycine max]|eukprot:XP_014628527.2 uncharacterized protein LOC102662158 [Glycine max]
MNDLQEDLFPDLFSASSMTFEEQTTEQGRMQESEITLSPLIPPTTRCEMYDPSPSYYLPTNDYEDFMAKLFNENEFFQLRENIFKYPLQPYEPVPLDDIPLEVVKSVEGLSGFGASASVGVGDTARASVGVDDTASASVGVGDTASACVGASVGYNASAGGIAFANFNADIDSSVVFGANASSSTTLTVATIDPQVAGPSSFGNHSMFNNTMHNPLTQFESCSSPSSFSGLTHHASSSSSSHQQLQRYLPNQMNGINAQGIPAMTPQHISSNSNNQGLFWLRPPPLVDFPYFVPAWEGSLVGRIHSYRQFLSQARVVRKPTSPVTLTDQWCCRLDIALFIPLSTVNYTMKFCGGPIDYVFFHIIKFNNLDLYDYMMSTNLCAKIVLPSQIVILSTTNSKYHFLGAIFSGDTVFIQPV